MGEVLQHVRESYTMKTKSVVRKIDQSESFLEFDFLGTLDISCTGARPFNLINRRII
jgi:hypothetical protein